MGANRILATPEAYPVAFLEVIRNGAGVLYLSDLPWQGPSAAKRFRLLLALLRSLPGHELHAQASSRWSVQVTTLALTITRAGRLDSISSIGVPLIEAALRRVGVSPPAVNPG